MASYSTPANPEKTKTKSQKRCNACNKYMHAFDLHALCKQCMVLAGHSAHTNSNTCSVCSEWDTKSWDSYLRTPPARKQAEQGVSKQKTNKSKQKTKSGSKPSQLVSPGSVSATHSVGADNQVHHTPVSGSSVRDDSLLAKSQLVDPRSRALDTGVWTAPVTLTGDNGPSAVQTGSALTASAVGCTPSNLTGRALTATAVGCTPSAPLLGSHSVHQNLVAQPSVALTSTTGPVGFSGPSV